MPKPIKMEILGVPTTSSNPSPQLERWKETVCEEAQNKANKGESISGDCHLYVVFFLNDKETFNIIDVDNLLVPFCEQLSRGKVIRRETDILGVKAHKNLVSEGKSSGALAMLIPTETYDIDTADEDIAGKQFCSYWKHKMQLIKTKEGKEFIDNMPGNLWGIVDASSEPGFKWKCMEGLQARGVTTFYSKKPWINKWDMHVLARVAKNAEENLSGAPKHIAFEALYSKGPATKYSEKHGKRMGFSNSRLSDWKCKIREAVKKEVSKGNFIEEDCHLYVVFSFPVYPNAHDSARVADLLKIFCDQLRTDNGERGVISDDARILGIKAYKQIARVDEPSGAFALLIPTETRFIENVVTVSGTDCHPLWKHEMQKIITDKGVFIDNMPGSLSGYHYPGVEHGYDWRNERGRYVRGVVTYKKYVQTPWINKWDLRQLIERIP